MSRSLPTSFFDEFYAGREDPWGFASSDYERDKYTATLASMPQSRYRSGFEVGCSIGVLTRRLALQCDRLLAIDAAAAPLAEARRRNADAPWVEIRQARIPEDWPEGESFDLILLSEVLYYFGAEDLTTIAQRTLRDLERGGTVALVHWLAETPYPMSGDEAVGRFLAMCRDELEPVAAAREGLYRLDVLTRR